jgi:hypothetical protein
VGVKGDTKSQIEEGKKKCFFFFVLTLDDPKNTNLTTNSLSPQIKILIIQNVLPTQKIQENKRSILLKASFLFEVEISLKAGS